MQDLGFYGVETCQGADMVRICEVQIGWSCCSIQAIVLFRLFYFFLCVTRPAFNKIG